MKKPKKETLLTDIIPAGKKRLLKSLTEAGFTTLESCARGGKELYKVRGVGSKTITALKEHCFRRRIDWSGSWSRIHELSIHFMNRYHLDPKVAKVVATVFFWDNCCGSSEFHPIF